MHRIVQGEVTCRVGFLQQIYVPHFQCYNGRFAQVREIFSEDSESKTKRYMHYHNYGCCVAKIMGPIKVAGVNDTSFDEEKDSSSGDDTDTEKDE